MKVAINITREPLAGITSTNLSLLDCLHESDTTFAGIELNAYRFFRSPIMYRHLSPEWFSHTIVSMCDYLLSKIVKRSSSLSDLESRLRPIISLVREILRKEKPDVLLVNGTYYIPWILTIAARKEKIPVVLWYAGVLTRETQHMTPKFRKIFRDMERSVVRSAKSIIFPSAACQQVVYSEVVKSAAVRDGVVVPNPIAPLFTRSKDAELPVERRIAFIGRNTPIKNIEAFCALHKELVKRGWKHEATIVSDMNPVARKKIPKSIKVVPSMLPQDLKTFYTTQGLIISPSHFETFGNVPIEAACIGVPVLVSESMGCAEVLIQSGLEKMVIDFKDKESVLGRVMELCGQQILPRQLNNVRKRVDTKYVAHKIVSVLNKIGN